MKKKNIIIVSTIVLLAVLVIGISVFIVLSHLKDGRPSRPGDDVQEELFKEDLSKEFPKIKKFLNSSKDFKGSKVEEDRENERIILAGKYNIGLRQGYMYFEVGYDEDIDEYCKIVEAIETGLGAKDSSVEACMYALGGSISNDYMQISYEEDKMLVVLNTKEAGDFSSKGTFYSADEKIAIGSKNFGMDIDEYKLSNTSSGYNTVTKSTNVCFTIMNKNRVGRDFKVSYYDNENKIVHEEIYSYTGAAMPAEHTCIRWENDDTVKYFSIK